jgi:2-amino-4-hydroxy-6-hydroxymethyldihydropteridine diphosphokinase
MNKTVLCIGSNTPNRNDIIERVIRRLKDIMSAMQQSSVYECESHSGIGNPYFNTVVKCDTTLTYEQVLALTKDMEKEMGRTPESKRVGVMPLDIDIVLWNGEVIHPQDFNLYHFRHGYEEFFQAR